MNRKWTLFCIFIVCTIAGTIFTLHLRRYQDGRHTIFRDFSHEQIEALRQKNFHLSKVLNSENKINFNQVTINPGANMSYSARTNIEEGYLEKFAIHQNILWAHHLSGEYRPVKKEFMIPIENGMYLNLERSGENSYEITSARFSDEL